MIPSYSLAPVFGISISEQRKIYFNHRNTLISLLSNTLKAYDISRAMQDEAALISQQRAAAIQSGAFDAEIIPLTVKLRKKEVVFQTDEFPKADSTLEGLAALRPAFDKAGTVTAGNASGINDGAAALVIMEEDAARAAGLTPLVRIRGLPAAA